MTKIAIMKGLQRAANKLDQKGHFDLANRLDLFSIAFAESEPNSGGGPMLQFLDLGN